MILLAFSQFFSFFFLDLWLTNCLAPQLQVMEGIDAVIVDSVLAIRKGLTGPNPVAPAAVATN